MSGDTVPLWPYLREVDQRAGLVAAELPLLSVSQVHGVRRYGELFDREPRAEDLTSYKVARSGDVVVNRMSADKGALGMASETGLVSPDYMILRSGGRIDPRFVVYALKSDVGQAHIRSELRGIGTAAGANVRTPRISTASLLKLRMPGGEQEQREIADYLDHETAEIDAFIADLDGLRAGLEEHRMAELASLLPYPSDLFRPQSASVAPLKHLGSITLGKMLDPRPTTGETRCSYLRAANVQPLGRLELDDVKTMRFTPSERAALDIRARDVLIVEGGQGGFGRAAYVSSDLPQFGFQNSIVRFRPGPRTDGRYIAYALHLLRSSGYIKTVASVTSMPHFTAEKVAATPVPRVSLTRQVEIANAIDRRWAQLDAATSDIDAAIALAKERRAALITGAVTGQIDIATRHPSAVDSIQAAIDESR